MKNKLALTALAIAMAAPSVATATEVKVGGITQIFYYASDEAGGDSKGQSLDGADVRVQVTASGETNGMTGYSSFRIDNDGLSNDDGQAKGLTGDSMTVGVKGDFGDFQMGEVSKVQDLGRYAGDLVKFEGDLEEHLGYTGSFAPVKVRVAYSPDNSDEDAPIRETADDYTGLGVEFDAGVATFGANTQSKGEDSANTIGAKGSFGGVSVAAHYTAITTDSIQDGEMAESDYDWSIFAVKVSGKAGPVSLALTVHQADDDNDWVSDKTRFDASVPVAGPVSAVLRYETTSDNDAKVDVDDDLTTDNAVDFDAESSFVRIGLQAKF